MSTYKFKMGRGPDAEVVFEDADASTFAAKVKEELAKIPPGLPTSFNFGPVVEMPDGQLLADLALRRWLANFDTLTCAPCPKCREREKLATVRSMSVGYVQCDACGFMGPQLMAGPTLPERQFFADVVRAWNHVPR
ncbi:MULTISPECIES: hypothetical protein [Ralstonia]|uniref:hypothetical protein n=1 Tax=Ralstonia TaxID=48736 RepID=UPI001267F8FC|nr:MULTISPECIES: hypothetical protein [Ralstonia]